MSVLRPYQLRDYNDIVKLWKTENSILYQCPTGGGKSLVIEHVILNFKKEKILILAHKRELVFQLKNRLEENGLKVGIIIGNIEENLNSNIIVASIRTVTREKRIESILKKNFDKIIIDEAHHIRTSSYENVLDKYFTLNPDLKIFGVTATPYRKDKKPLDKYFKNLICSDSIQQLQEQGYLAKYRVFYTPVPEIDKEVETSGNDYQIQSLGNYMMKPQLLQFLVDSYKKEGQDKQMIIFCVDKKHAKAVKEKYISNGYKSVAHIDSDTPLNERDDILYQFAINKLKIITCIETLTEGVDLPETGCIQLARPTKSLVLYLQMVGRGSRPKRDKNECIILDNAGCTIEHKLPNSPREWSLNPLVNPSNPLKRHKILGKRKDGSFTEDADEMEFLELIEMTGEDYALNIKGGIEKYKKENELIDLQCIELLKEIGNFVISKIKEPNFTFNSDQYKLNYFSKDTVEFTYNLKQDKNNFNLKYIASLEDIEFKFDNYSYRDPSRTFLLSKKKVIITMGMLTEYFLNPKHLKTITDKFELINELQESKTNISKLENDKKEFDKKQNRIKLENHLLKNKEISIEEKVSFSKFFTRDWNWDYFNKMIFTKNKLTSNNEIIFMNESKKISQKSNIKPEKVLEMLEGRTWS